MASVGGFFKAIAPYVSAGLSLIPGGGPAVDILKGVASKVLGKEVKAEDLTQTISDLATTEQGRIQLKQMELEYSKAMQELGFDHEEKVIELGNADRDSARKREMTVKDRMPMILGILAVVTLLFCICLMAFADLKQGSMEALLLLIGFVGASYKDVYAYFFGSSAGSAAKTELLAQAPPVQGGSK